MSNISIKLNLEQLKNKRLQVQGKNGVVDCLVIPIKENNLHCGEKGVYIDISAIEIKDKSNFKPEQKDTHLLKQNLPKEVYEKMSEEEKKSLPILGNCIDWGKLTRQEPEPQQSNDLDNVETLETDELPF